MIKLRSALVAEVLLRQADYINYRVLAAAAHESATVPAGARYARVTATGLAYAKLGSASFAVPAGDITDGTGPIMLPPNTPVLIDLQAQVDAGSPALGFVAAAIQTVQIEYFA